MNITLKSERNQTALESSRKWTLNVRLAFYAVLFLIMLGYTGTAFQMDWITESGRIGPGFFPRIIGVLSMLICSWALLKCIVGGEPVDGEGSDEDEVGEGDLGRHPFAVAIAVVASFTFVITLNFLGAIVAAAVFLFVMLSFLNRGRWLTNSIITVAVPVGMYLLFQTALNAGLPAGILPRF